MDEIARRQRFVFLFAVVFYVTGAHASQSFVNYAAWQHIGIDTFAAYHHAMAPRAGTWILLPRMLEIVLAVVVLRRRPTPLTRGALLLALALAIVPLVSTILIQRPIHGELERLGNTPELLGRLQDTNWFRLIPEWIRAGLYVWMASRLISVAPEGAAKAINSSS